MIFLPIGLCWLLSVVMSCLTFMLAQGAFQAYVIPAKDSMDAAERFFKHDHEKVGSIAVLGFALSKGLTILAFAGLTSVYYLGMVDYVVEYFG